MALNGFDTGHPSVLVRYRVITGDGAGPLGYGTQRVSSAYGYYIPLTVGNETESALALMNVLNAFGDTLNVTMDEKPLTRVLNHAIKEYSNDMSGYGLKGDINVIRTRSASGARITKVLWGVGSATEAAARDLVIALRTDPVVAKRIGEIAKRYGVTL
jgi:hypothetical protein